MLTVMLDDNAEDPVFRKVIDVVREADPDCLIVKLEEKDVEAALRIVADEERSLKSLFLTTKDVLNLA